MSITETGAEYQNKDIVAVVPGTEPVGTKSDLAKTIAAHLLLK